MTISVEEAKKAIDGLMTKVWGSAESEASVEMRKRGQLVDFFDVLTPPAGITTHYMLDGTCFSTVLARGYLEAKNKMNLRENDVILASYPKTGTTWVQEIIYGLMNKKSLDQEITESIDLRAPVIEMPECGFQQLLDMPSPRLIKTHLHYDELPDGLCNKKYKIVATTRNPKDTAVSLYHFLKMITAFRFSGTVRDCINLLLSGKSFMGPFWRQILSYWNHQKDGNVLIVKYEDLHSDIRGEIRRIAKFLNIEIDAEIERKVAHRCGFDQMAANPNCHHNQWTEDENIAKKDSFSFMRKGKIGDWKNHFDPELNARFDAWIEEHFGGTGLTYRYE